MELHKLIGVGLEDLQNQEKLNIALHDTRQPWKEWNSNYSLESQKKSYRSVELHG